MMARALLPLVVALAFAAPALGGALQVEEGVVVKFGPDGELVVRDGLFVVGGALFTSELDDTAAGETGVAPGSPASGDWLGVRFEPSAMGAATRLEGLRIRYAGRGGSGALRLRGTGSTLFGFTIEDASGPGLFASGAATTTLSQLAIRRTGTGVFVDTGSSISFTGSLIEQNGTGAAAATTGGALNATGNWWGHPSGPLDASNDTAAGGLFNPAGLGNPVSDGIDYQPFSSVVPLFGLGFTLPEGDLAGDRDVPVELRAPTASAFRLSEDPGFAGVPFQPMTNRSDFLLSAGEGLKTIHAQFQAPTGNTASLSRTVRLDTGGPLLALVQPMAGAILSRPVTVLASASDPAGVERVEFLVDGVVVFTDTTNDYSFNWDIRGLSQGSHQLGLRARDTLGRETLVGQSFSISPTPPAAPVIASPQSGIQTAAPSLTFTGTAEPMTTVTLRRGGAVAANTLVGAAGTFSTSVAIPEGLSVFTAVASDLFGISAPSSSVSVLRDSAPPDAPTLIASIVPGNQVRLQWTPPANEPAAFYRVYSAAATFGTPGQATLLQDNLTATQLLDRPAADGPRFYGVAAVDGSGNQGPLSNIAQVTFDASVPTAAIVSIPAGPVGPGAVELRLTASEALASTPVLTVTPAGGTTTLVELTGSGPNQWSGTFDVATSTPSGNAQLGFSGTDASGNTGTQITAGAVLAIDTRGPSGTVALVPSGTVGRGALTVTLTLDEPAAGTPVLRFLPPTGGPVAIALGGGPSTWTGELLVTGTMGDGAGSFELEATDALGNTRSGAVPASPLTLDTTPPATPLNLVALTQPAGAVRLTFDAAAGAQSYSLYRLPAGSTFPDPAQVLVVSGLTALEHVDTPPADGTWRFGVSAVDEHGNESGLSADAVAVSDRNPPAPPSSLTLALDGAGIRLTWTAPGADPTDRYRAFRSTSPIASVDGLAPLGPDLAQATLLDTPPADGDYHYAVVAVDTAGNASAPASAGPQTFDQGAPAITITGVTDGLITNANVTPAFAASDFAIASVEATLDGATFASGTPVTAEGPHVLVVTATDTSARTAERTVSFTIDKTVPAITITGVVDGGVYTGAVTPVVAVADANPGAVTTTLNGAPFVSGTPVAADGAYVLSVATQDLGGNPAQAVVSFTLDGAPGPPVNLLVLHVEGQSPVLSWTAPPQTDVVGYRVRRNGTLAAASPIVGTSFVDAGFAADAPNLYEVSALDAGGNESAPARATLAAVALTLESYGLLFDPSSIPVFDPSGGTTTTTAGTDLHALTRRYLDRVTVKLENRGADPTTPGAVRFILRDGMGTLIDRQVASGGQLAAGASRSYTQVVPSGAASGSSRQIEVEVDLPSGGGTGLVRRRLVRALQMRETPLAVEVFSDPLVRGATAAVRVKLLNHGSTPIQLLTAAVEGPTPEVEVRLRGAGGTLLSSSRLEHRGAGTTVTPSGVYVTIPVGGSFLSPAIPLQIPSIAPDQVLIEAVIGATHHALFTQGDVVGSQLAGVTPVSIGDPPYLATAHADRGLYDQGEAVQILGRAFDTDTGDPMPNAVVKIGVSTRGFVRNLFTTADASGDFSTTFQPLATEAGAYTVWATHPSVTEPGAQDQFQILGLELRPTRVNARFSRNGSVGFPVRLKNTGELPLGGLAATVTGGPGISGTIDLSAVPSPLAPGQSAEMRVTLDATIDAPFANFADIELSTTDGAVRTLAVQIELLDALPTIRTDPSFVEVGVSHDSVVARTIVIRNVGFAPLTGITIDPPSRPWIRLASASELPAIPPGGAENVTVLFNPDSSIDQGVYGDDIVIRSGNHVPYTVNLFATVTSATRGGVEFEVRNILNELVPGANVSIRSSKVPDLQLNGTTDANGRVLFDDLPTGPYQYKAQATGHEVSISSFSIDPDTIKPLTIYLNVAFVSLEWSVSPIVIEDRYEFTLTATFETSVPAPVLTADPAAQTITLAQGSTYLGNMRITNHGLIAADDVQISANSDPRLLMETLVTSIPRIDAMQSYDVPWRLTRLTDDAAAAAAAARGADAYDSTIGATNGLVEIAAPPPLETAAPQDALDCIKPPAASSCGTGSWICPAGFATSSSACSSVTAEEPEGCDAPDCESCAPCTCLGAIPGVGSVAKGICECLSALSDTECVTAETVICDCLGAFIEGVGEACTCLTAENQDDMLDCLLQFVDVGDVAQEALDAIDNLTDAFTCGVEIGLCLLNLDIEIDPGTSSVGGSGGGGGWGGWGGSGGGVSGGWYCD